MRLFDWITGRTGRPADKTGGFIFDQLGERAKARDVLAIAEACVALDRGGMAFGMIIGAFPSREKLLGLGLPKLRELVEDCSDREYERLVELLARTPLGVDLRKRAYRYERNRDAAADAATIAIRVHLQHCSPEALVNACQALLGSGTQIGGTPLSLDAPGRADLERFAFERLQRVMDTLDDDEAGFMIPLVTRANLPIDVVELSARITDHRRTALAKKIEEAAGEPRNPDLERAIDDQPESAAAYAVLADWLSDRHHPRGELILLQLAAETDPTKVPLVDHHLDANRDALLGGLASHRKTREYDPRDAFTWRRGFIQSALLSYQDWQPVKDTTPLSELLQLLLAHPSGSFLERVLLGINGANDAQLDDLIGLLVIASPRHLRELVIGDFTPEQSDTAYYLAGNLAPIWTLPTLRSLSIHAGEFALGQIAHATIERVVIKTGGLTPENATALATAMVPNLRHLDLWYGDPNYGGDDTTDSVRTLLARTDLPKLEHLGLKNALFTNELPALLARSHLAGQLRELDLGEGTMSPAGAAILVELRDRFPELETLDVSNNYLDDAALAALRAAYPEVVSTEQRADGYEDRYVALGE